MPELPEVEVLVRHLAPLLRDRKIQNVTVRRDRIVSPATAVEFSRKLRGTTFGQVSRRGKYLLFELRGRNGNMFPLIGHLGMTGRMYLLPVKNTLPKHAAVVLDLGPENFVFEDTRYFGRLTLDATAIEALGPEPLGEEFTVEYFSRALQRSAQPIKVKLLDQSLVAGVGNIYASEALFRAGVSPLLPARRLKPAQVARLWHAIRETLADAIARGSTVPLNHSGEGNRDGLFYFGSAPGAPDFYEERLRVYDRAGKPCATCGTAIKRIVQAARSTFYCPTCQKK
ncbi:MAG TPA: bifunctional DNA-formamidopyrimidine glycosylase/DNA-(apurinic or apyrimidinic site) lyase [Verrucomicrobiae bacterium]|jgi:formamidopyrimidine-DNA glycosylase